MKKYNVTVNGTAYEITIEEADASSISAAPAQPAAQPAQPAPAAPAVNGETVKAPMPGNILSVNVTNGAKVKKGDVLVVLEAMKMENEIMATCDGTVVSVNVTKGAAVDTGAVICVIA